MSVRWPGGGGGGGVVKGLRRTGWGRGEAGVGGAGGAHAGQRGATPKMGSRCTTSSGCGWVGERARRAGEQEEGTWVGRGEVSGGRGKVCAAVVEQQNSPPQPSPEQ